MSDKPAEAKPAAIKPPEAKPAEVKPQEVKPAVAKPAEIKAPEVKPAAVIKPPEAKSKPLDEKLELMKGSRNKNKCDKCLNFEKKITEGPCSNCSVIGKGSVTFFKKIIVSAK